VFVENEVLQDILNRRVKLVRERERELREE
jgi:hypothetical protein